MPAKIIFNITKGSLKGKIFEYPQKESLILGRSDDCHIVFTENTVSRYHCLVDIAPPIIAIRDFGSLNAT